MAYSCRYARHMRVRHGKFHYDMLNCYDVVEAAWQACYCIAFFINLVSCYLICNVLWLLFIKYCIITCIWGYVIVGLLCKKRLCVIYEYLYGNMILLIIFYLSFWCYQRGEAREKMKGSTKIGGAFDINMICIIASFVIIKKGEYVSVTSPL